MSGQKLRLGQRQTRGEPAGFNLAQLGTQRGPLQRRHQISGGYRETGLDAAPDLGLPIGRQRRFQKGRAAQNNILRLGLPQFPSQTGSSLGRADFGSNTANRD